jgi:hypothetical protein
MFEVGVGRHAVLREPRDNPRSHAARFCVCLDSGSSGGKVIEDHPSDAACHASCISPIWTIEDLACLSTKGSKFRAFARSAPRQPRQQGHRSRFAQLLAADAPATAPEAAPSRTEISAASAHRPAVPARAASARDRRHIGWSHRHCSHRSKRLRIMGCQRDHHPDAGCCKQNRLPHELSPLDFDRRPAGEKRICPRKAIGSRSAGSALLSGSVADGVWASALIVIAIGASAQRFIYSSRSNAGVFAELRARCACVMGYYSIDMDHFVSSRRANRVGRAPASSFESSCER